MNWTTFKGVTKPISEMEQEHLSNCIWFYKIFWPNHTSFVKNFQNELNERFNGQLLPYRPHIEFKNEIQSLIEAEMLVPKYVSLNEKLEIFSYDIHYNYCVIGEIISTEKLL